MNKLSYGLKRIMRRMKSHSKHFLYFYEMAIYFYRTSLARHSLDGVQMQQTTYLDLEMTRPTRWSEKV